jgi:CBS domain-containing protein
MDVTAPVGSYLTPSFEHATAADAMRPCVLTCTPETPLVTVAQRMAGEHVHALVVMRPRGVDRQERRPWGVLTDRDLLKNARRVEELTAGEVATPAILEIRPDDRLSDVAERMAAAGTSHAIVEEPSSGRPVGVVSTLDIAGILAWGRA